MTPGRAAGATGKNTWFLLSLAVLALDQWSKWLVELHLPPTASQPLVPGLLALTHVRNTGVAFGLFAAHGGGGGRWLLLGLGALAVVVVGLYFRFTPPHHRRMLAALALILGGAAGNILDRLAAGAVTDFLDVYYRSHHWPAFNVADSAITVGIGLMILDALLGYRREG